MTLTRLTETDLDLILPWRNAPAVRRNMYSHHEIAPDEHRAWFQRMQQDSGARWYLCRDAADNPRGVVYFTALNPEQGTALFWLFWFPSSGWEPGPRSSASRG